MSSRSETWINLAPLKLLWDLDPSIVDLAGDVGAPFGHGPVLGPANVRTFASHEVDLLWLFQGRTGLSLQVMLSSVQAYKGGYMAGQQHAWQVHKHHLGYFARRFQCDFRRHWKIIVTVQSSQRNPLQ